MNVFTNEDYRRIQAWLKANAIKDSDLDETSTIDPDDIIAIVHNVKGIPTNLKIKVSTLLNSALDRIIVDAITANAVTVGNILKVNANNVDLGEYTLQQILDTKLNNSGENTFNGNLTVDGNVNVTHDIEATNIGATQSLHVGNVMLKDEANSLKANSDIKDKHGNVLNDVNSAAKNWKIEQVAPTSELVKDEYRLLDYQNNQHGPSIKIYKDSAIQNVYLGTMGDSVNPDTGAIAHGTGDTALCIVYIKADGKYELVKVNVEEFLQEAEFKDGLQVSGHKVSIKLSNDVESQLFLHFDENGALTINGIRSYMETQLGTHQSEEGDGSIWGEYKLNEGSEQSSTTADGSRWGEFKRAETIRDKQVADEVSKIQAKVEEVNLDTIKQAQDSAVQAIDNRETEVLSKTDASFISANTPGLAGNNVQANLNSIVANMEEAKLYKFPNATIVGSPTIDRGQVSGFSKEPLAYMVLPFAFDSTGKRFELNVAFVTGSDVTTPQNIIGSAYCMAMYLESGKLNMRISSNGTSWDIWSYTHEAITFSANTPYYVKLSFDGLNYSLKLSTNGKDYTTLSNLGATQRPHIGLIYLGIGNNYNNPFKGIIDLNNCNLLFNGEHYWEGMDDAGLATRMATDMSNIDDEGKQRLNDVALEGAVGEKVEELEDTAGVNGIVEENSNTTKLNMFFKELYITKEFVELIRTSRVKVHTLRRNYNNVWRLMLSNEDGTVLRGIDVTNDNPVLIGSLFSAIVDWNVIEEGKNITNAGYINVEYCKDIAHSPYLYSVNTINDKERYKILWVRNPEVLTYNNSAITSLDFYPNKDCKNFGIYDLKRVDDKISFNWTIDVTTSTTVQTQTGNIQLQINDRDIVYESVEFSHGKIVLICDTNRLRSTSNVDYTNTYVNEEHIHIPDMVYTYGKFTSFNIMNDVITKVTYTGVTPPKSVVVTRIRNVADNYFYVTANIDGTEYSFSGETKLYTDIVKCTLGTVNVYIDGLKVKNNNENTILNIKNECITYEDAGVYSVDYDLQTDKNELDADSSVIYGEYGKVNAIYSIKHRKCNKLHIYAEYKFSGKLPIVDYTTLVQFGRTKPNRIQYVNHPLSQSSAGGLYPGFFFAIDSSSEVFSGQNFNNVSGNTAFVVQYTGSVDDSSKDIVVNFNDTEIIFKHSSNNAEIARIAAAQDKTLSEIVDAINATDNFRAIAYEVANKTYGQLLYRPDYNVKLVITRTGANNETYVDNVPVSILLAEDNKTHTIEAIYDINKNILVVAVDGYTFKYPAALPNTYKEQEILFGSVGSNVIFEKIHCDFGGFADAELVNDKGKEQLISNNNPHLIIWEGHGVDFCKNTDRHSDEMSVSTDKLFVLFDTLDRKGYKSVTWQDVIEWKIGNGKLPKRCYCIMMDDFRVANYMDCNNRIPFNKYNVKVGLAIIEDLHVRTDELEIDGRTFTVGECFDAMIKEGWYPCSHAKHVDLSLIKPSEANEFLKDLAYSCNKLGIYSDVLVYPYGKVGSIMQQLKISPFKIGVNVDYLDGSYVCKARNNFYLTRCELGVRDNIDNTLSRIL